MAEDISPIVLEEVVELAPEDLSDEQKTFLEENKATLTPEQATKFGITQEIKPVVPEEVVVETRTKVVEKPKAKDGEEPEIVHFVGI